MKNDMKLIMESYRKASNLSETPHDGFYPPSSMEDTLCL